MLLREFWKGLDISRGRQSCNPSLCIVCWDSRKAFNLCEHNIGVKVLLALSRWLTLNETQLIWERSFPSEHNQGPESHNGTNPVWKYLSFCSSPSQQIISTFACELKEVLIVDDIFEGCVLFIPSTVNDVRSKHCNVNYLLVNTCLLNCSKIIFGFLHVYRYTFYIH